MPSHFRYEEQALLYLPPGMPDPREPTFGAQAARTIRRVLDITRGRAFCLFTSYQQMRDLYERLLPELDYPCLLQGTAPRKALLEEFRNTPNAVLFGTSSFWQGVDVQGEALSCVIVDRLPFSVPTDPVVSARMRAVAAAGGQSIFRLPGAGGGHHAEAGLWAADPLARRPRRAGAAGSAHRAATVWKGLPGEPATLPANPGHRGSGKFLRRLKRLQISTLGPSSLPEVSELQRSRLRRD